MSQKFAYSLLVAVCYFTAGAAYAGTTALGSGQTLSNTSSQCSLPEGATCGRATYVLDTNPLSGNAAATVTKYSVLKCMGSNPAVSCPAGFVQTAESGPNALFQIGSNPPRSGSMSFVTYSCIKASEVTVGIDPDKVNFAGGYDAILGLLKSQGFSKRDLDLFPMAFSADVLAKSTQFPAFDTSLIRRPIDASSIPHTVTVPLHAGDFIPEVPSASFLYLGGPNGR